MIRLVILMNTSIALPVCLFMLGVQFASAQSPGRADGDLAFEQATYQQVREGYFTLKWNPIAKAVRYEVVDRENVVAFNGTTNQAFLSGLEDGEYRYRVRAFDKSGALLAESSQPAEVLVDHWSMQLVSILFAVGLVVVLAVAIVLVIGANSSNPLPADLRGNPSEVTD